MRRLTWFLLLAFAFAMPWEYSLELGPGIGNIARVLGILAFISGILAVVQSHSIRMPGSVQWLTLILYLWLCLTLLWSLDSDITITKLRGYFQELMIVWLLWEFVSTDRELRAVFRAWLAGSWILAILTAANFATASFALSSQIRFAALGQDPNDVARYLNLALPIAAYLFIEEKSSIGRLHAFGYFPVALLAVLLTASRAGLLVAIISLSGCALLLARRYRRGLIATSIALPLLLASVSFVLPRGTLGRFATIASQLNGEDLNQRANIWQAGWSAFLDAPFFGHGAGTFVQAAGLSPIDTAHNTALSVAVEAGLIGLLLGVAVALAAFLQAARSVPPLRAALLTAFVAWICLSMVGTTGENRKTWLLFGVMSLAGSLAPQTGTSVVQPAFRRLHENLLQPQRADAI